ncbi:MAG: hypothetical protein IKE23_04755, partial [Exiguobacterium sp.]|nr:hypothetical protein [Exiguobacterium sp.]
VAEANAWYATQKAEHDRLQEEYRKAVDAEARKLEVKPYDDVYRKFASQHGLRYIVEKRKKRK